MSFMKLFYGNLSFDRPSIYGFIRLLYDRIQSDWSFKGDFIP